METHSLEHHNYLQTETSIKTTFSDEEIIGDWWIPPTKGQLCGKCFHLITSSWEMSYDLTHSGFNSRTDSLQTFSYKLSEQDKQPLAYLVQGFHLNYWGIPVWLLTHLMQLKPHPSWLKPNSHHETYLPRTGHRCHYCAIQHVHLLAITGTNTMAWQKWRGLQESGNHLQAISPNIWELFILLSVKWNMEKHIILPMKLMFFAWCNKWYKWNKNTYFCHFNNQIAMLCW